MRPALTSLAACLAMLMVGACGSTTSETANTTTPSQSPSAAAASPSAQASAVATTVDPCQLVTSSEASQLTGASYGAGKPETTDGGGKLCWYGAQTTNVFEVFVGTAADASTAQGQWDQYQAKVQAALQQAFSAQVTLNVAPTSISGVDRAATVSFSKSFNGQSISGSGVYLLKGAVFVALVDLVVGHPAPTSAAMEAEAQTVVGRLP